MSDDMNQHPRARDRKPRRRRPLALGALLAIGLIATGGAYTLATVPAGAASETDIAALIADGEQLFQANCASCHGLNLEGTPDGTSLIGVGAAAVDFQVATGRMPMEMTGPQAPAKPVQFTPEQIAALAAYVGSVSPGPEIPNVNLTGADIANGGEIFRVNCAMCHNVAGAGGALTEGKYAPPLAASTVTHTYEAMITGPQNMPVFDDANLTPQEKADIIAYLQYLEAQPSVGGFTLGGIGPVSEGLFVWIGLLGLVVGITIWLTAKSN
jgi:ubiquinol-cytochrome c reductase cytochrome c subunit